MGADMSCMLYAHYVKLKDPPSLNMVHTMSIYSATGHDSCLVRLMHCEVTIGKSQFKHSLIVCKTLPNRTCYWS